MECQFIPNNLKLGATVCAVTVVSNESPISVRWCAEKDYPEKLIDADSNHSIRLSTNGTYCVELITGNETIMKQFSVCHLKPAKGFEGGDGTAESPYLIATCAQFNGIRSNLDAYYRIVADLEFEREMKNLCWLPMGYYSMKSPRINPKIPVEDQDLRLRFKYGFTGELDGGGYTISGLTCKHPKKENVGIFGSIGEDAYIHDMVVQNCSFSGKIVGTIASRAENAIIERCILNEVSIVAADFGGGVVGEVDYGIIIRACEFVGNLTGISPEGYFGNMCHLSGIAGYTLVSFDPTKEQKVEDCCVKARMEGIIDGNGILGGDIGVIRCYFSGSIEATERGTGITLPGRNKIIQNCVCVDATISRSARSIQMQQLYKYCAPESEDAWLGEVSRITIAKPTTISAKGWYSNYCTSSCKLIISSVECPIFEGSWRDGITISDEMAYQPKFYTDLGWDFDNIWEMGIDGLPQIKRKQRGEAKP